MRRVAEGAIVFAGVEGEARGCERGEREERQGEIEGHGRAKGGEQEDLVW